MTAADLKLGPVVQVAYFAPDARAAAVRHAALTGSGPFFVMDNIPLARSVHRGQDAPLDHTSAYGQWGEVMVEFVQQNNDGPSAFRDMYAPGEAGLHHLAVFVDSVEAALARTEAAGFATALDAETATGLRFAMADARAAFGHMLEFYEPVDQLTKFYGFVRKAADGWDGADPVRTLGGSR